MTCIQLCALFTFQICGTFPPVFMNRLTLYKCTVSAFIQRSIHNVEMPSNMSYLLFISPPCQNLRMFLATNAECLEITILARITERLEIKIPSVVKWISVKFAVHIFYFLNVIHVYSLLYENKTSTEHKS